jgi:hypothetical protein
MAKTTGTVSIGDEVDCGGAVGKVKAIEGAYVIVKGVYDYGGLVEPYTFEYKKEELEACSINECNQRDASNLEHGYVVA